MIVIKPNPTVWVLGEVKLNSGMVEHYQFLPESSSHPNTSSSMVHTRCHNKSACSIFEYPSVTSRMPRQKTKKRRISARPRRDTREEDGKMISLADEGSAGCSMERGWVDVLHCLYVSVDSPNTTPARRNLLLRWSEERGRMRPLERESISQMQLQLRGSWRIHWWTMRERMWSEVGASVVMWMLLPDCGTLNP